MKNKKIVSIVLTGGPHSGKSSMIPELKVFLERLGFYVIPIGETAREITNAIPNWATHYTNIDFQKACFKKQLEKEENALAFANNLEKEKVAILYDTALLDSKAYIGNTAFNKIREEFGFQTTNEIYNRYDCIIHLETIARVDSKKYNPGALVDTKANDAEDIDNKINRAWALHKNRIFVGSSKEFEEKIDLSLYLLKNFLEKHDLI